MKLTRYGTDVIIGSFLVADALIIGGYFVPITVVSILMMALGAFLLLFTIWFFRDPERTVPAGIDDGTVLSTADGKVVVVQDIVDNEYHKGPAKQVSIFLSPLNVHVNRHPISGEIDHYRYVKGEYLVAFHEKASDLNERTHIGVRNSRVRVFHKQIAGAVARRIVCNLKVGDQATIGERFGMIKFGSRVDLIVPPEATVHVKLGDIVVAGETVIFTMP
ncbi:MAG: phosphatidylserine decarboxylase family protein [Armatimonadetes bacterium]|nr:phosphatidylserine decarboxylase family protein [Armatimonadota bacterium]